MEGESGEKGKDELERMNDLSRKASNGRRIEFES